MLSTTGWGSFFDCFPDDIRRKKPQNNTIWTKWHNTLDLTSQNLNAKQKNFISSFQIMKWQIFTSKALSKFTKTPAPSLALRGISIEKKKRHFMCPNKSWWRQYISSLNHPHFFPRANWRVLPRQFRFDNPLRFSPLNKSSAIPQPDLTFSFSMKTLISSQQSFFLFSRKFRSLISTRIRLFCVKLCKSHQIRLLYKWN